MSEIYILEPPTFGRVIFDTTCGPLDILLWSKECPKTCLNFIQLCLDGYYNGCTFHTIIKDFIVQTGDPTNTGYGMS
jgi:peptidyl-prolyl cis-trans isomerase SDCCAG10